MVDQDENDLTAIASPVSTLTEKVISILWLIVFLSMMTFITLILVYLYVLLASDLSADRREDALSKISHLAFEIWDKLAPFGQDLLRFAAPVVVIFLALLALRTLIRSGAAPAALASAVSDLPSILALIIIVTLCILPLAGISIPTELNNVALVVVGFYFGKREWSLGRGS